MMKKVYDEVGTVSVLLNEKLNELKACAEEKEAILKLTDEVTTSETLEENLKLLREKINANQERFKKVISEIEELNKKL